MTQTDLILEYLRNNVSAGISAKEAFDLLGVERLSARIWDIKHAGHTITFKWETAKNRRGEPTTYKRYYLAVKV